MGLLIASHELSYLERISDKIFFLNKSADSGLGEVIDRENYVKYQQVYEIEIGEYILNAPNIVVQSTVGRVYTVVAKYSGEEFENILKKYESQVIQYDELPVSIEDIFIFKNSCELKRGENI